MWKKKISILLAAALVLGNLPGGSFARAAQRPSGQTGRAERSVSLKKDSELKDVAETKFLNGTQGSFSWKFTAADGVLTIKGLKSISGSSVLPGYSQDSYKEAPWFCTETGAGQGIRKIILEGTVQSIGAYSFYCYPNVEEVDLSAATSLTAIGRYAFYQCGSQTGMRVTGTDKITTLEDYCFFRSTLLEIALPEVTALPAYCFGRCEKLTQVTVPKLKSMGGYCFAYCTSMTQTPDLSGYIGTTLPAGAFQNASNLSSAPGLEDNTSITEFGDDCFRGTALKEVTLPANTRTLGNNAFYGCRLTKLPNGIDSAKLTTIKVGCFGDNNFTEITIPPNITTLQESVFSSCKLLKKAEIAAGSKLTSLPSNTFYFCTALEEFVFPEDSKITTIGKGAFQQCAFTSFVLPAGVTSIGEGAFSGIQNLEQISFLADNMKTLDWTFQGCSSLQQILIYGSSVPMNQNSLTSGAYPDIYVSTEELQAKVRQQLSSNSAYAGDAEKPAEMQKIRVLTEADKSRKSARLEIALSPNSLTQEAIRGGSSFQPEIVKNTSDQKTIRYFYYTDAFGRQLYDAQNPEKVPEKVGIYYIRGYVTESASYFHTWSNVVQCRVDGILEEQAYTYDSINKKLTIKETTDHMAAAEEEQDGEKNFQSREEQPWGLFRGEIESVAWDPQVKETRIGDYMFSGHGSLKTIAFPDGIVKIGKAAFSNCSIESMEVPEGVESIGDEAFQSSHIGTLTLPETLESIGASAFRQLTLESVLVLPASVNSIGASAFQKAGINALEFPQKVKFTQIPASCFSEADLSGNTLFAIPDGVETLGENAFFKAKLTRVIVPASVTRIEKSAFQECASLKQAALLNEGYTMENIRRADVVINYRTVDSIFAGTPDDLMICCEGDTYDLLGDVTTYNYGNKLYSSSVIMERFDEIRDACAMMESADYPEEAWDAFDLAYTDASARADADAETIFDKINVVLQAEQDIVDAAGVLLVAAAEDAGKLREEDYTTDTWIDFYYAYQDLNSYFDMYGTTISREDISYLVELNAEMAGYRRNLEMTEASPAPGESESPAPGETESPAPGETGNPAPGGTDTPGTPAPGTTDAPAAPSPAPQQPSVSGKPSVELKKPSWKKAVSRKKKTVSLQWKKTANASGYQVSYSSRKDMKKAKVLTIKKPDTTSKTISGLKSKKICYVRVRAWTKTGDGKIYSSWSSVKKIKVK
ncbi:MAG: leucine-rich repeat protein [Lachnospiraceae bacterium]|nr:leucine-rich repeat protein [Lachnospiraceae bacterium]